MRIIRHLEQSCPRLSLPVVTLGNFDGVHRGHQEILARVVRQAAERRGDSVVITFFPHPAVVLAPDRAPAALAPLGERLDRIRQSGVGIVILQRFTRAFAQLTPEEFIQRVLVDALGAAKVIIGHSVNFGQGRRGSATTLEDAGPRHGFEVEVVGPVTVDGIAVSSTEVRQALSEGNLGLATRLLGRSYSVEGRVVVGDRRGRTLGFPTANLRLPGSLLVPDGVYAVRVELPGEPNQSSLRAGSVQHSGIANVGRNPTFGAGRDRRLEVHLFDFDGDLYGQRLRVSLIERVRGEMRFASPAALIEQIQKDVAAARRLLGN